MNPRWHTLTLVTLLIGSVDLLAQETLPTAMSNGTSRTGWDLNASLLGFFYTDTIALWNPAATADHVYAGAQIIEPSVLPEFPAGAFSLNRVWDALIAQGRLFGVVFEGRWLDVGTPAGLARAEAEFAP